MKKKYKVVILTEAILILLLLIIFFSFKLDYNLKGLLIFKFFGKMNVTTEFEKPEIPSRLNINESGVYKFKKNGYYYVIISEGQQSSINHDMEIEEIKTDGRNITVKIDDDYSRFITGGQIMSSYSYCTPHVMIRCDKKPRKINVEYINK